MSPIVKEIGKELEGKIKVCEIDVDNNQELASQYSIMSIPAFKIFKDGNVIGEISGAMPKEELLQKIESIIRKS